MSSATAPHLVAAACAVHEENPGELAVRCFSARRDEPALNPRLGFACVGFARVQGDWLGVVITPQCVDLVLLPGGGSLWGDIPAGQRRYVELSHATLAFVAAADPCLGSYQHAALVSEISTLPDMAAAIRLAEQFMTGICGADFCPAVVSTAGPEAGATAPGVPAPTSRRDFFRRLAGKR
jgi:[NiFe] hydrogenase assembly HybE family chaperone